jgi:hypothetical protein
MFAHYVGEIVERLANDANVAAKDLVEIEWAYFPVLRHSRGAAKSLQKALATFPSFFVQLLGAVYLPDKGASAEKLEGQDKERAATVASHAWNVLGEWRHVPGTDEGGIVDSESLRSWVGEARTLCAEAGRAKIGDIQIGKILAAGSCPR